MKYLFVNVTAGAGSTGQLVLKAARELRRRETPACWPMAGRPRAAGM